MLPSDSASPGSAATARTPAPSYRTWITAASIAACSLTAGSIFCFPLFSPSLTRDLDLTLKQTSSIWVGAVLGEYGFAAPSGIIADRHGPRILCLVAAVLFFLGYNLMGREEAVALAARLAAGKGQGHGGGEGSIPIVGPSGSYIRLAFAFFLCGAGVSASYFSAVTAATRTFPNYPSLAIALPLTLFSLSSMLLSAVGSTFFADPATGDLNTRAYLYFLAYMLGIVNLLAGFGIHHDKAEASSSVRAQGQANGNSTHTDVEADEHTALIPPESRPSPSALPYLTKDSSLSSFFRAPSVWAIALLMFIAVGACEMLMSCVGNVVQSLLGAEPGDTDSGGPAAAAAVLIRRAMLSSPTLGSSMPSWEWRRAALEIRGTQIRLLATMNTLSRLGAGILADLCAPTSTRVQNARRRGGRRPKFVLSRLSIILAALVLLFVAFSYAALGFPPTEAGPTPLPAPRSTFIRLSLVSISTGLAYGLVFTLAPSILASAFDVSQFGRNWGLLSYACAAGSLSYTMLYASVSDWVAESAAHVQQQAVEGYAAVIRAATTGGQCLLGPKCFQLSFVIAAGSVLLAIAAMVPLWRAWRHAL
ncbi:hypothetical protein V8E36_005613 [Tilletia maclaganii]